MTGAELAGSKNPDKLTMISYLSQVYEAFRKEIPVLKKSSGKLDASDEDLLDLQYRHNHQRSSKSGVRRKLNDASGKGMSIGQLVASEAKTKKKRRSKETSGENNNVSADLDDLEAGAGGGGPGGGKHANNKENIRETERMNKSENKKRLQKLMERAEASKDSRRKHAELERRSIKKEERYRIIEEQFAGGPKRRSGGAGDSSSKYRESKKPKELKRAIGKLDKDDWNIRNIEEKLVFKKDEKDGGSKKDKVPKWSKEAFEDKFNIMKGKLEQGEDGGKKPPSDMDTSLARLQRKLREGSTLETGQRGQNRVSALAEGLFDQPTRKLSDDVLMSDVSAPGDNKRDSGTTGNTALPPSGKGGSETCHFCEKRVYVVERMSAEGKFFHRSCFRCDYCNILLRLGSYVYHREGPFGGKIRFAKEYHKNSYYSLKILWHSIATF